MYSVIWMIIKTFGPTTFGQPYCSFRYMNVCPQFDAKSAIYHRGLQPSNTGALLFLVFHQYDVVKVRSQQ